MSAFNGSGTFVVSGTGLPYVTGTAISSTVGNQLNTDLATGLSTAITRDGQTTTTAVIPFAAGISIGGNETLSTYDEGPWTPIDASGAGLVFTSVVAYYTRIGRQVTVYGSLIYPVTVDGTVSKIGGLPFTVLTGTSPIGSSFGYSQTTITKCLSGTTTFQIIEGTGTTHTNAGYSGIALQFTFSYFV